MLDKKSGKPFFEKTEITNAWYKELPDKLESYMQNREAQLAGHEALVHAKHAHARIRKDLERLKTAQADCEHKVFFKNRPSSNKNRPSSKVF